MRRLRHFRACVWQFLIFFACSQDSSLKGAVTFTNQLARLPTPPTRLPRLLPAHAFRCLSAPLGPPHICACAGPVAGNHHSRCCAAARAARLRRLLPGFILGALAPAAAHKLLLPAPLCGGELGTRALWSGPGTERCAALPYRPAAPSCRRTSSWGSSSSCVRGASATAACFARKRSCASRAAWRMPDTPGGSAGVTSTSAAAMRRQGPRRRAGSRGQRRQDRRRAVATARRACWKPSARQCSTCSAIAWRTLLSWGLAR